MRILLVDDNECVLRVVRRLLRSVANAHVIVCVNGEAALNAIEQYGDFDKIFCDLQMPVMDGMDFYKELMTRYPHLTDRLVFASGSTEEEPYASFINQHDIEVMPKPYGSRDITQYLPNTLN